MSRRPRKQGRLPGDPTKEQLVERMVRVDHAGEYGAVRIYSGQLAVLGRSSTGPVIREMAAQEQEHLAAFDALVVERRVRPSALMPLWHVAGFALGAGTALFDGRAAMACTVAVEEVIDEHYAEQIEALEDAGDETDLKQRLERFRADEIEHRDTGLAHVARQAPGYEPLTAFVKAGSRLAIWLSERI